MCVFHIYVNRETIKGGRTRLSLQGTFSYTCPPLYLYIHLCTLVLQDTTDSNGVVRYPVGTWPILDPASKEVIIDSHGRRSYTTSMAYGPSLGVNVAMGYLPAEKANEGDTVLIEYFGEHYEAKVMKVGYGALLDPTNERPKS